MRRRLRVNPPPPASGLRSGSITLSAAQEHALRVLSAESPRWIQTSAAARANTLDSLEKLGLAESRTDYPRLGLRYRITAAGTALLSANEA